MNKFLALAFLTLFIIALVPGLKTINVPHVATADTKYVTVLFILNESKTIYIIHGGPAGSGSYYYIEANYSGYAILPANTTIIIGSWYPFEVNGSPAWVSIWPGFRYVYFINFTHNTVVYINFVQNKSLMRIPIIGQPVTNATSTINTTTTQAISPTEGITIAIGSLVLVVTVVIIVTALASRRGK